MTERYRIIADRSDPSVGLHVVACPLCDAESSRDLLRTGDFYAGQPGEFTVVRCDACGFVYTNPRPFGERLASFYPDEAGYYQPDVCAEELRAGVCSGRTHSLLERHLGYGGHPADRVAWPRAASKVFRQGFPHFVAGGTLLEVGCSFGGFLYQLQCLGWKTRGLEFNARAAEFATRALGLEVVTGTIENADLAPGTLDCVVMRMVLEHIASPVDCLAKLGAAMRPGGQLVLAVPNIDCPEFRMFGKYSYFLHVPQHMSHFTPESLARALSLAGFVLERIFWLKSTPDLVESARRMAEHEGHTVVTRLLARRWFRRTGMKLWLAASSAFGRRSRMMVYARKRTECPDSSS